MKGFWIKVKKLPYGSNGMTIFPFVFYKKEVKSNRLETHERIHLYQQAEMLFLPFFIWYFAEFFIHRLNSKSWHQAYMKISFEKEAYGNDCFDDYLCKRKFYSWIKYL